MRPRLQPSRPDNASTIFDALPTLFGDRVFVEKPRQRYILPGDVPPPPGMTREEFDQWSRRVCGFQPPLIEDGQVFRTANGLHMNASTWAKVKAAAGDAK